LRLQELTLRPKAVESVLGSINATLTFIQNISETLETKEGEVEDILELSLNVFKWLESRQEEQSKLQVHETPAFTSHDLYTKWKAVETKVKTLLRRPKKKISKPEVLQNTTEDTNTNQTIDIQEETIEDTFEHENEQEHEQEAKPKDDHSHDEL